MMHYLAVLLAGVSFLPPPKMRLHSRFSQITSSIEALKIEEYVPEVMPMRRASTKLWMLAPPNRYRAKSVSTTVIDVLIERASV
jgi:hypothetical protein